jgi:hypothetical protein
MKTRTTSGFSIPKLLLMKFYSVLVKKSDDELQDAVTLHDGFSFNAFLFGALWFLYHKMWYEFALISVINIAIFHLPGLVDFDQLLLSAALYLIVAFNANSWFENHLQKKCGYKFLGMVGAANPLDAKLRFFQNFAL